MPDNDQITGYRWMNQYYSYDALNRLESVTEQQNGSTNTGTQSFTYDRYGNRTINTGSTSGFGINNKPFTIDSSTNRLGVPGGQSGTMTYDAAGNLTYDSYSGEGTRTYDAENRMTTAWANAHGKVTHTMRMVIAWGERSTAPKSGKFMDLAENCWLNMLLEVQHRVRRRNTAIAMGSCW